MKVDVLGRRIRALRDLRGMSARRLAEQTNFLVTRDNVSDLENGRKKDLGVQQAAAIAQVFGVTLDQLLDESISVAAIHIAREVNGELLPQITKIVGAR